ncbi:hypothetical protein [Cobetia amphilecti]|nr:hypothetical protein [Cobetia amphilecti]MBU3007374.1 hypothetical protein [Cobetia amphilecti]
MPAPVLGLALVGPCWRRADGSALMAWAIELIITSLVKGLLAQRRFR